jgi:hypothetical protein
MPADPTVGRRVVELLLGAAPTVAFLVTDAVIGAFVQRRGADDECDAATGSRAGRRGAAGGAVAAGWGTVVVAPATALAAALLVGCWVDPAASAAARSPQPGSSR